MGFSRRSARSKAWPIALLAMAIIAAPAGAAMSSTTDDDPITWAVTPADAEGPDGRTSVDLSLDPGATVTDHVAVRNLSETEATFSLVAADGYYTDTGRFNMLTADVPSVGAGTWITIAPSVTIAAGATAVVPYTVTVPRNATPGDHAAGVAASVRTSTADADGTRLGVDSRIGFRVSTRVSGELAPVLEVHAVQAEYVPSWSLFTPGSAVVTYTVVNAGNTTLAVRDSLSGTTTDQGNLLPGEERTVTIEHLDAWPLGLLFLDLVVEGDVPGETLTAAAFTQTVTLWAIPWLYLLTALGIALIVLAIFAGRRRNKRRLEQLIEQARESGRRDATEAIHTS